MTDRIGVFTAEDAREIRSRVLGASRTIPGTHHSKRHTSNLYYGVLLESLYAATNPLTGHTQADVRVLRYTTDASLDMEEVPGDQGIITITNRSKHLSGEVDDFCIFTQLNAFKSEWAIIWIDCPSPSASSQLVLPSSEAPPP